MVRAVQMTGASMVEGIEEHGMLQTRIRVFCPAKTVADCFKCRNKIGIDVAIEALREGWRKERMTIDELTHYGQVCRVTRVMRPYLEALL